MPSSNPRYACWSKRESIRRWVLATQDICGICGRPVDKTLGKIRNEDGTYRWHPLSPVVDEIIPISKGGSPYDRENVQLAHRRCNAIKGARVHKQAPMPTPGGVRTSRQW